MMRPFSTLSFLCSSRQYSLAWRHMLNVPFRWTAMTASQSSSAMLKIIRSRRMPALLTTMLSLPKVSIAHSTIRLAALKSATLSPLAIAVVTLASGLAVLGSDLLVTSYRDLHRDALWFVVAYCAVQALMVVEFARDGRLVPWLAVAKALAALLFFASFFTSGLYWMAWTPGRYVYQLFGWAEETRAGLFALAFLGRGTFNTLNAFYFTRPWWSPLRVRRPLLGRAVTTVPVAAAALCTWAFLALVREETTTFSSDAQDVARTVLAGVDCERVRANDGKTTTDLRQRGERRYRVEITYGCELTRVLVQAEDGRVGTAAEPQRACCGGSGPSHLP